MAYAQAGESYTLSGYVKDSSNGEDLIGAAVSVPEAQTGAYTNNYGFFSLTLPAGKYSVQVSYSGYNTKQRTVDLSSGDQQITFELSDFSTETIEVVTEDDSEIDRVDMGMERVDIQEVRTMPMLFGEADLIRAVQYLPGVQAAGDGNTGFNVRGGGQDQNMILLDEANVYNPSHLLGFFSVFNSDAIKGAELYKGGMPARYGGRLSSFLDIRMREGNRKQYGVKGGLGIISSRLTVEGPIVRDKGSFIASGRRTYADVFLPLAPQEEIQNNRLYFYDLNFKANYDLGEKDRIYLSGYFGRDVSAFSDFFRFSWGNATGTARWNHIFGDKLFMNTSLIVSDFEYVIGSQFTETTEVELAAGLRNYTIKSDLNYYSEKAGQFQFGFQSTLMEINPGRVEPQNEQTFVNERTLENKNAIESAIYGDHKIDLGPRFSIRYGLRLSHFASIGPTTERTYEADGQTPTDTIDYGSFDFIEQYYGWEPRLGIRFKWNERTALKFSFDRTMQYVHLLTNSATSLPVNQWWPSGTYVEPQMAEQLALGFFRTYNDKMYEASVEVYYKFLHNQLDYRPFANLVFNEYVETEILAGEGRAYGAEFMIKKRSGKLTGWASYTYSRTFRTIEGINDGQEYVAVNDRPHYATILLGYQLNKKWKFGATWLFASGQPITYPVGSYLYNGIPTPIYEERNNYRLPDYHRLDLSATYTLKPWGKNRKWQHSLNMSVYNAYGRKNPWAIIPEIDEEDPTRLVTTKIFLFQWVPSITYNFEF